MSQIVIPPASRLMIMSSRPQSPSALGHHRRAERRVTVPGLVQADVADLGADRHRGGPVAGAPRPVTGPSPRSAAPILTDREINWSISSSVNSSFRNDRFRSAPGHGDTLIPRESKHRLMWGRKGRLLRIRVAGCRKTNGCAVSGSSGAPRSPRIPSVTHQDARGGAQRGGEPAPRPGHEHRGSAVRRRVRQRPGPAAEHLRQHHDQGRQDEQRGHRPRHVLRPPRALFEHDGYQDAQGRRGH